MDFDEYEYLEKAVENPEPEKVEEKVNGGDETVNSEGRDRRRSSKHKSDDNGNDSNHRSKRTKSRDESREHDRERGDCERERKRGDCDRERASSRHRSSLRDEERSERDRYKSSREDRDKEKQMEEEDRNVKDRDRGIEREKDREQERRVRDHENDKERDKDSERERSHRSMSHSERQRDDPDREKSRDRERNRDRELKEREKEKELREMDRRNRRYKEKREDVAEPEVDPERDQRTVFAYQICLKADERDVYEFFSRAGKVRDVRLIMDRNSRRSKGVGYIEFYDAMYVPMAIALSGQTLLSQPVMVKPSEAEKNLVQSTASAVGGAGGLIVPYSGGARRLYIGNLHFNIREDQLRQVFEPFGNVELVQLPLDQETGHGKGYGFVQFARLEDARAAESLNGQLEIAGRAIKVSAITDQAGMQDIGANPGDFDDDEGGGLSLNARSRAILMQKLDRSGTASSITGTLRNPAVNSPGLALPTAPILGAAATGSSLVAPVPALAGLTAAALSVPAITVPSVDIVGVPSECVLLKNLFDPNSESEPDFDIKEDVQDECSKYGMLKHIFVDKDTAGFVYLRFDNTQAALGAQRALHGRWFAGKMITATFMLPQNYESKFPEQQIKCA